MYKTSILNHSKLPDTEMLYRQAEEETVQFKTKIVDSKPWQDGIDNTWSATYNSNGKNAEFLIKLLIKDSSKEIKYPFSVGAIVTQENEDNQLFLKEVAEKFKVKDFTTSKKKQHIIGFETAILGDDLYKGIGNNLLGGKFTDDKQGEWLLVKAFIGDKKSEFYLAINTNKGLGEIYQKDPEYNQEVIKELSKVF